MAIEAVPFDDALLPNDTPYLAVDVASGPIETSLFSAAFAFEPIAIESV